MTSIVWFRVSETKLKYVRIICKTSEIHAKESKLYEIFTETCQFQDILCRLLKGLIGEWRCRDYPWQRPACCIYQLIYFARARFRCRIDILLQRVAETGELQQFQVRRYIKYGQCWRSKWYRGNIYNGNKWNRSILKIYQVIYNLYRKEFQAIWNLYRIGFEFAPRKVLK